MSWEQHGFKLTGHVSGGNLSASQYRWVKGSAAQTVNVIAANTDRPLAVLANGPDAAGQSAELVVSGVAEIECAGTITAMDPVGPSANGRAETRVYGTDTTKFVGGTALTEGVAGDIIPVLLCAPHRAV